MLFPIVWVFIPLKWDCIKVPISRHFVLDHGSLVHRSTLPNAIHEAAGIHKAAAIDKGSLVNHGSRETLFGAYIAAAARRHSR